MRILRPLRWALLVIVLALGIAPGLGEDAYTDPGTALIRPSFDRLVPTSYPLVHAHFDRLRPTTDPVIHPDVAQVGITDHLVNTMAQALLITYSVSAPSAHVSPGPLLIMKTARPESPHLESKPQINIKVRVPKSLPVNHERKSAPRPSRGPGEF